MAGGGRAGGGAVALFEPLDSERLKFNSSSNSFLNKFNTAKAFVKELGCFQACAVYQEEAGRAEERLRALFVASDSDGDGNLDFGEFTGMVRPTPREREPTGPNPLYHHDD